MIYPEALSLVNTTVTNACCGVLPSAIQVPDIQIAMQIVNDGPGTIPTTQHPH